MSSTLIIKPSAEEDITDAFLWYQQQQVGLGVFFVNEIDKALDLITVFPNAFEVRYEKVRIVFTDRFPFGVHYIFEKERIFVLAVLHTSSDPSNWKTLG